jgi:cytochrome b
MSTKYPVWDFPTRLFHWLIAFGVGLSWWSGELGEFTYHAWVGYMILVLVCWRIMWGFVGSQHSRFADFLRGPKGVWAYLRGTEDSPVGHNPAGGWSVAVLLLLLLVQSFSGLFNSDDLIFDGPFYFAASVGFRDFMGVVHEYAFYALQGFILLHIAAVVYYQWIKKMPIVQAMIYGKAASRVGQSGPAPLWWALVIVVLAGGTLWWAVSLAPKPQLMW